MSDSRYFQVRCMCCGRKERRHASAKRCVCGGSLERLEGPPTELQRIRDLEARLAEAVAAKEAAERLRRNACAAVVLAQEAIASTGARAEVAEAGAAATRSAAARLTERLRHNMEGNHYCPACYVEPVTRDSEHIDDCPLLATEAALAPDAGKVLLARLERLQALEHEAVTAWNAGLDDSAFRAALGPHIRAAVEAKEDE